MLVRQAAVSGQKRISAPFFGACCFLFALAFALRLNVLGPEDLGLDGLLSVGLAREQWPTSYEFQVRDPHPPLYYLALRGWLALAGVSFESARWPSVASGLIAIALTARVARDLAGPLAGLVVSLLLGLSPAAILTSATARDFAPGLALSLFALWLYPVRALKRPFRSRDVAVLAALTAGATLTWHFHLFFVLLQAAFLALRGHLRRRVAFGLAMGLVATTPWFVVTLPHLLPQFTAGQSPVTGQLLTPLPLAGFSRAFAEAAIGDANVMILAALAGVSWLILAVRLQTAALALALMGSVGGLGTAYAAMTFWGGSALPGRYISLVLPFLFLAPATALAVLPGATRALAAAALLLWFTPMITSYAAMVSGDKLTYSQWPAFGYLSRHAAPGDAVLFTDIAWRGGYDLLRVAPAPAYTVHFVGTHYFPDEVDTGLRAVRPSLMRAARVWVVNNQPQDPSRVATEALVMERLLLLFPLEQVVTLESVFGDMRVYRYGPGPPPAERPIDALFGSLLRLRTAALPASAQPGETLALVLTWETLSTPAADYSVFIHVRDLADRTVAQHDGWPRLESAPTTRWEPGEPLRDPHVINLPASLPPGEYRLVAGLYAEAGRLSLASGGNEALLGYIQIK